MPIEKERSTVNLRPFSILASLVFVALGACAPDEMDSAGTTIATQKNPAKGHVNHGLGFISEASYDALQTNAYLRDHFVDVEIRTTVRPDITYTGTYLNTRDTYTEFFPEGYLGSTGDWVSLAVGNDVTGGLEHIRDAWNTEFGPGESSITSISRYIDGVPVPWFRHANSKWNATAINFGFSAMAYFPNPGSTVPRTRREERSARYNPSLLAKDVQSYFFGFTTDYEFENFQRSLQVVGWQIFPDGDEFLAISPLDGGTRRAIHVRMTPEGQGGLLGVVFQLNRVEKHTEQLGDAVLRVGVGGLPIATLWFVPPTEDDDSLAQNIATDLAGEPQP